MQDIILYFESFEAFPFTCQLSGQHYLPLPSCIICRLCELHLCDRQYMTIAPE